MLGATAVVLGMVVPMVTLSGESVVHAAAPACSPTSPANLGALCVESSTDGASDNPYHTGIVKGQSIGDYKWLVNEDTTGDPSFSDANVAACLPLRARPNPPVDPNVNPVLAKYNGSGGGQLSDCPWPSVHASSGHAPVIASGDATNEQNIANLSTRGDRKYLLSVTAGGYKIDGVHFEVGGGGLYSVSDVVGAPLIVQMNPLPKKTATIRVHVFNDNASSNGQWDGQTETLITCDLATPQQLATNCGGQPDPLRVADPSTDMSGFSVSVADVLATTTTDVYGNPLCTQYQLDSAGNVALNDDGTPNPLVFPDGGVSGGGLSGTEATCISDHYGDIVIPNMGPNRYGITVVPPDPRTHGDDTWIRTTTLEGGHDWDSWNIEGGSGFDTELIVGGERVPPIVAGFVKLSHNDLFFNNSANLGAYYNASSGFSDGGASGSNGELKGTIKIGRAYIGSGGAAPLAGTNITNAKADGIIEDGIVSISCIATCSAPTDSMVWAGRAMPDGTFDIKGLETGDYVVSLWDEAQSYILATMQYSVYAGPLDAQHTTNVTDMADVLLPGWFTDLTGHVFNDLNGDGVMDPGEPGIPDFGLGIRTRGNSLQDQGNNAAVTNDEGEYDLSQAYPLGQFLIAEAYNPRYKNTGFTYTTDNDLNAAGDPIPHTVNSAQVDIDFLPVIGLSGTIDWGVQAYGTGDDYWSGGELGAAPKNENGGIVGTVTYDVTRNEFDPAFSAQEDYQPGVSGIPMQLWKTQRDPSTGELVKTATGAIQQYGIGGCARDDSSRGTDAVFLDQDCKPFDYYVTESWTRPTGCTALDVNGNPLEGELALPDHLDKASVDYTHTDPAQPDCIEAPMSGFQIGGDGTVDGNYALTSLMHEDQLGNMPAGGGQALQDFYAAAQGNPDTSDTLASGDYIVEAVNPVDTVNPQTVTDPTMGGYVNPAGEEAKRLYRFTDETAINVMGGDGYVPQDGYSGPPAPVPPDPGYQLSADPTSPIRYDRNSLGGGTVALCAGSDHEVPAINSGQEIANPDLNAAGGNPYSGRHTPICDAKLVTVAGGRSMPAGFFMYTDVPIPSKFYGLVNDDLNVQTDRRSIMLGEVAPLSNGPVGVYDENGNWKYTAHSDVNGFYEILLPSTGTYNCPLPAGPCANVYRLVGNDPGTLDHRNTDYNPQFRTIATEFQAWPGVVHPVDQAPTHNGITIEGPAAQFGALSLCALDAANPVLFSINKPFYDPANRVAANPDGGDAANGSGTTAVAATTYTIKGSGFGATQGLGTLKIGTLTVTPVSWFPTQITFQVPTGTTGLPEGAHQITITAANGLSTVNGLTFHRLSPSSSSTYLRRSDVYEVSSVDLRTVAQTPLASDVNTSSARIFTPLHDAWDSATNTPAGFAGIDVRGPGAGHNVSGGRAIQRAIEAANRNNGANPKLVVVYPNTGSNYAPHNPTAAYFENVVVHGKVKLQGVGPGGAYTTDPTHPVYGTNIDASQFWSATQVVPPGGNQDTSDGSYSDDWRTFAGGLPRVGTSPADLPEGEAILAIARTTSLFGNTSSSFRVGVDGMLLNGGDQQGNPGNINTVPGAVADTTAGPTNPGPAQGGAIMLDQYVRDFNITNNQIQSNGGTYGTIRIGTPDLPDPVVPAGDDSLNHNDGLNVANNRIVANGGTNLAGALGIFAGTDNYKVTGNDFCGNFSAEYGGAISHYGKSNNGVISKNRIYYNQGYDEGGGIMIAGALPLNNRALSPGAGAVTIDSNTLISNQSNDDGGGIRFLMAGNFPETVKNNIIANNLSTHEGGGVALDDSPNVTLVNNTIVKNITTGTAATNAAINPPGPNPAVPGDIRPANPAGLSTGGNSNQLQATLSQDSPNWSKPVLINNIFADNRAGWAQLPTTVNANQSLIHGIGDPSDTVNDIPVAVQHWDVGVSTADGLCNSYHRTSAPGVVPPTGTCSPTFGFDGITNTTNASTSADLANVNVGAVSYQADLPGVDHNIDPAVDGTATVGFVKAQDFPVDSLMWRNNTNVSFPVIVAQMVPITLLADYHLMASSSLPYAVNAGTNPSTDARVPACDIDNGVRPAVTGTNADRGADELGSAAGCVGGAPVVPTKPTLSILDNFNRAVSNSLNGPPTTTNWSQAGNIGVNSNQASSSGSLGGFLPAWAYWSTAFAAHQAAALTFANNNRNGDTLILKATGSPVLGVYPVGLTVQYSTTTNSVTVNSVNGATTNLGTFSASFAQGDTMTAVANADGSVDVWKTTAAPANVTTFIGHSATSSQTGGGRIGVQLNNGARIDDFAGGTLP